MRHLGIAVAALVLAAAPASAQHHGGGGGGGFHGGGGGWHGGGGFHGGGGGWHGGGGFHGGFGFHGGGFRAGPRFGFGFGYCCGFYGQPYYDPFWGSYYYGPPNYPYYGYYDYGAPPPPPAPDAQGYNAPPPSTDEQQQSPLRMTRRDGETDYELPDSIMFNQDSAQVSPNAGRILQDIADAARDQPGASLVVEGHTDTAGTREHNQALSDARARAVAEVLVREGVALERIRTEGMGEEGLAVQTGEGVVEPRNRRVVVRLISNNSAGRNEELAPGLGPN
jgi:outer membrane protein OmpA-like peptidoglycan-associated protein